MQPSLRTGKGHRDQMSNTVIKETVWRASRRKLQCRSHRFNPWVGNIPWRRKWQPTPVFLLVKSYRQKSLVNCSPGGCKSAGHDLLTKLPSALCQWR